LFSLDVTPQLIPIGVYNSVQISAYTISVATTVLSTLIIVIQILWVSRMPGASRQPRVAMEIIIESAILYSISALAYTAIISSIATPDATSPTYALYVGLLFAYMAVASHSPCLPVLVF
jgi:preprotein translocase subunit Sec61beta